MPKPLNRLEAEFPEILVSNHLLEFRKTVGKVLPDRVVEVAVLCMNFDMALKKWDNSESGMLAISFGFLVANIYISSTFIYSSGASSRTGRRANRRCRFSMRSSTNVSALLLVSASKLRDSRDFISEISLVVTVDTSHSSVAVSSGDETRKSQSLGDLSISSQHWETPSSTSNMVLDLVNETALAAGYQEDTGLTKFNNRSGAYD
jgi:hypothetical protein